MTTPLVNYKDVTDSEVQLYNDLGYLMLPGFLNATFLESLKEEALSNLEHSGITRESLYNATTTGDKLRQCSKYLAGSELDRLINSPRTLNVASRLIGGKACRYLPFTAVKSAGGGEFHLHQDNNYTCHSPVFGSINIWVAFVDMMPENGCLQMIPYSQKDGTLPSKNAGDGDGHQTIDVALPDPVPIRMRAGDAVAFTRATVHGSGSNQTSEPRIAYALQYHRDDVSYIDPESGESRLLTEDQRWDTEPLDCF